MQQSIPRTAWFLLAALALIWGSSYILIKIALTGFSAAQVGSLRMLITGAVFFPVALRRCRGFSALTYVKFLAVGLAGTALPSILFPMAQGELSSSLAGTLSSLTPLLTLAVGAVVFGRRVVFWQFIGILIGLLGALVLVIGRYGWLGETLWPRIPLLLAVLATLCYALSSNMLKAFFGKLDPVTVTAGSTAPLLIIGSLGLLGSGGLPNDFGADPHLWKAYLAVSVLSLLGTALATWLFFRLIQLTEPVFASTVSYLVPLIALVWGITVGETVNWLTFCGLLLILGGVKLSRR